MDNKTINLGQPGENIFSVKFKTFRNVNNADVTVLDMTWFPWKWMSARLMPMAMLVRRDAEHPE